MSLSDGLFGGWTSGPIPGLDPVVPEQWDAEIRKPGSGAVIINAAVELALRIGYSGCSMTLTEKLLARASGKATVQAGDNIWVNADVLMTHDVCGPGTIGVF